MKVHVKVEHDTFNDEYALRVNGEVVAGREMTARDQVATTGEFWVDEETLTAVINSGNR